MRIRNSHAPDPIFSITTPFKFNHDSGLFAIIMTVICNNQWKYWKQLVWWVLDWIQKRRGHQTRASNRLYANIFFLFSSSMELLDSYQFIDAESGSKRIICSNDRIRSVSELLTASQSTDNDCFTLSSCYSFVCVLIVHSFFFSCEPKTLTYSVCYGQWNIEIFCAKYVSNYASQTQVEEFAFIFCFLFSFIHSLTFNLYSLISNTYKLKI